MSDSKAGEQLLKELIRIFSQVIGNFPYPIAIFKRNGALIVANRALLQKAGISPEDVRSGRINFLGRITDENFAVLESVEDVFLGETTLLKNLVEPISMFARDDSVPDYSDCYQSAVFFPVAESSESISHGAVMLLK